MFFPPLAVDHPSPGSQSFYTSNPSIDIQSVDVMNDLSAASIYHLELEVYNLWKIWYASIKA